MHRAAPPAGTPDGSNFLRPLLHVLRVRRWIVAQALVIVPAAAIGLSLLQEPRYEATSQVLVSRTNLGNVLTGTQDPSAQEFDFNRIIQTQANLARTPRVAQRTVDAAKLPAIEPAAFLAQSSVRTDPNTDILTMKVTDGDRERAIALASSYAREFVAYKQAQTVNRLLVLRDDLQEEADGLDPDSTLARSDRAQLSRIRNLISLGDSSIAVVQTARSAQQIQPRTVRNAIFGVLAGLALGIGLAFFVDLLDTRLRRGEDVAERLGLPLLGRVPAPPKALRKRDRIVTLAAPESPDADAFRVLRTNLAFADIEGVARTILVSSAIQGEGKSTTAANLAVALARAGRHVILADLDLRRPTLERFFEVERVPGATNVLVGDATLDAALKTVALDGPPPGAPKRGAGDAAAQHNGNGNGGGHADAHAAVAGVVATGRLELLTSGDLPPNVGELVAGVAMRNLLARLRERCDVLLVDTPPMLQVGDALALTAYVDAVVVVVRLGVVRRRMLDEVRERLAASPVAALGIVITGADVDDATGGYGYYSYDERAGRRGGRGSRPTRKAERERMRAGA